VFLLFGFMLIGGIGAAIYIYLTPKTYQAQAIIKSMQSNSSEVLADAELLRSPKTIEHAIQSQGLNVEYYQTQWHRKTALYENRPFTATYRIKDKQFYKQNFSFQPEGEKTYAINYNLGTETQHKRGNYSEPLDLGFIELTIEKTPYINLINENDEISFNILSDKALAEKISEQHLNCTAKSGNLIEINCFDQNPVVAYKMANSIANGYGTTGHLAHESLSLANVELINNQLSRVSQELDAAQQEMSKFQVENNAYEIPQQAGAVLNTISQLQIQKVETDMQLAALDNLSDYLRKNRNVNTISPEYGTITDIIYTETYLKLNDKVAERQQLKEQGADVSKVDREISSLKDMLAESIRNTRKKLVIKQETLSNALASAKSRIQYLPEAEGKLQQLNRNIYLYNKLYDFLIQKRAEAMVDAPVLPATSYIVQEAKIPTHPFSPQPYQILTIGLLAGLIAGLLLIHIKPYLKITISNRKDLQSITDIPFLANISNQVSASYQMEEFMTLSTKILMIGNKSKVHTITVTSAFAGDGKSIIAENLAQSLGRLGKKVLLVDMNPINPTLKQNLIAEEGEASSNMADLYHDHKNLHQAVHITDYQNVDLLTAGYLEHGINTLLVSDKTGNILDDMKSLYDFVIFDTPETSNYMDAVPLMKMSDLSLFVVKADKTTFNHLEQAEVIKNDFQIDNVYIVLNGIHHTMNHSGLQTSGKIKRIRKQVNASAEIKLMPRMLKKAALWFY
jgi:capsular exopolysaccharide synthesis family protein